MFYCIGFHLTAKDTNFFLFYILFPLFFRFFSTNRSEGRSKDCFQENVFFLSKYRDLNIYS